MVLVRFTGVPVALLVALLATLLIHACLVLLYFFGPQLYLRLPEGWGGPGRGGGESRGSGTANGGFVVAGTGGAGSGSHFTGPEVNAEPAPDSIKPEMPEQALPVVVQPDVGVVLTPRETDPLVGPADGSIGLPQVKRPPGMPTVGMGGTGSGTPGGNGRGTGTAGTGAGAGRVDAGGAGTGNGDYDGPMIGMMKDGSDLLDRGGGGGNRGLDVKEWGKQYAIPMSFYKEAQNPTVFSVTISSRGAVLAASVKKSCGADEVDEIRMATVRQTTFKPRIVNGTAVQATDMVIIGGQ